MGRGIDFKGVNLVINYDFPPSAISYVHRIGNYRNHFIILNKYCNVMLYPYFYRSYWSCWT
jgi:hypothetical protein